MPFCDFINYNWTNLLILIAVKRVCKIVRLLFINSDDDIWLLLLFIQICTPIVYNPIFRFISGVFAGCLLFSFIHHWLWRLFLVTSSFLFVTTELPSRNSRLRNIIVFWLWFPHIAFTPVVLAYINWGIGSRTSSWYHTIFIVSQSTPPWFRNTITSRFFCSAQEMTLARNWLC